MAGLRDKVVIVTGSSAGIGAATALEFAKVGAKVVLTARRRHKLEEIAQKCQDVGLSQEKILMVTADIMNDTDLQQIVDRTVETFGRIDVVVNNAGSTIFRNFKTSTADDIDQMFRMHVRAVFVLTKLALPHLLKYKGNVVNVSSVGSHRPLHYYFPSTIAKCGQDQMMKAAAIELGPTGVRLNSVCPGAIATEIFDSGFGDVEILKEEKECQPAKRIGRPEEVAKVIVFLASDDASFVSGVNMPVDTGRYNTSWIPASRM